MTEFLAMSKERQQLYDELARLQTENEQCKEQLQHSFGVMFLKFKQNSDDQFNVHTGLRSAALFDWVVELARENIIPIDGITVDNQVLLVLMKIKLNLLIKDLATRFKIPFRKVSLVLHNVIPVLSQSLDFMIKWPDRETNIKTMPSVFKATYPRCRVIIDCTEIFMEKPSNHTARAQTWSNYKHHNTIKILVGITPTGCISYVSKCWGGRVSDKQLTLDSDFLDFLEYGDQVLADRGFLIGEELANNGVQLVIPAFTKGKKQLSQREQEVSRQIARVRIHVERVMRRIKTFNIVSDIFPICLQQHADDIVTICCALSNLLPNLVQ